MKNTSILLASFLIVFPLVFGAVRFSSAASVTGSVSGIVFVDAKCDGLDLSDKPLARAKAELSSKLLKKPITLLSDTTGNFLFSPLKLGLYTLRVEAGKGYIPASDIRLLTVSEVSGPVAETFVFCPKK